MAKKEEYRSGKSKMTVMIFQMEGSDETLQSGLDKISKAVESMTRSPVRMLTTGPKGPKAAEGQGADDDTESAEAEIVGDDEEDVGDDGPPSAPQKKRTFRSPKILDLNLAGLGEFVKQKPVGEVDARRYLVIAKWLKDNAQLEEVTADHIHTSYRHLGWMTPKDAGQPLRKLKNLGYFHKGDGIGSYKLNHVGENAIQKLDSVSQ